MERQIEMFREMNFITKRLRMCLEVNNRTILIGFTENTEISLVSRQNIQIN